MAHLQKNRLNHFIETFVSYSNLRQFSVFVNKMKHSVKHARLRNRAGIDVTTRQGFGSFPSNTRNGSAFILKHRRFIKPNWPIFIGHPDDVPTLRVSWILSNYVGQHLDQATRQATRCTRISRVSLLTWQGLGIKYRAFGFQPTTCRNV